MSRMTSAALLLFVLVGCAAPQPVRRPPPPLTETRTHRPAPLPQPPRPIPAPRIAPAPTPKPAPAPEPSTPIRGTFVVDAGHGGKDPGATGVSARAEKVITLEIARKLAAGLRRRGANVIMSRDDDRFIPLGGRASLAERHRADLFISIHADAAQRAAAEGASVYIARNASSRSESAARAIDGAIRRAGITSRGVKRAGFQVLVGHSRPAVLIECGYLTNRGDARRLNDDAYQSRLVSAILAGLATGF